MAAVTIASSSYHQAGDMQVNTVNLTSVADTNTWDTGLGVVDNLIVSTKSGTATYTNWASSTVNGQIRITFTMQGSDDLTVTVLGR